MRKRSIRSKITLCLMAIITVMILLSGILSVIFIKKYYYNELKNNLIQTYQLFSKIHQIRTEMAAMTLTAWRACSRINPMR